MILVDTSVLIGFFKGEKTPAGSYFKTVLERNIPFGITSLIYQEILQGAKSRREYERLDRYLSTQRFYHPKDPVLSFAAAARIYFLCRRKGITVRSTVDCLIAQIAIEHNLLLLHSDKDFEAMAEVIPLKWPTI
ncbi:MAG: PIN domain nuclease [Syntrophobacteraceae bacterium]